MKHFQFIIVFLVGFLVLSSSDSLAQNAPIKGRVTGVKGQVYGRVLNEKGGAIDFATVVLMKPILDTILNEKVTGYSAYQSATTESNGEFLFEDFEITPQMKVRVSSFGYENQDVDVPFDLKTLSMGMITVDLGKISMVLESTTELEGVKITAKTPLLKLDGDKRVFDVSQNPISDGGTGEDVMKNVPGVNVDIDGNVSIRNSAPQIYIDGRPTTLTLDQIPASSIDKVEVMTNPSARYDASGGGAGIINIVLKKNKKTGYNGSVRAGMDSYLGVNGGANINIRNNKINFSLGVNGRSRRGKVTTDVLRNNYRTIDTLDNVMTQKDLAKRNGGGFSGELGLDYLPTNKTSFSFGANVWRGLSKSKSLSDIYTDSVYANDPTKYYLERQNNVDRSMLFYGLKLGFKQLFKRTGEELTVDLSYNSGGFESSNLFVSDYHQSDSYSPIVRTMNQKVTGSGGNYTAVFKTDYVVPLSVFKIETGLRVQLAGRKNLNNNYYMMNDEYVLIPNPASNYSNIDNIYAAYFMVSKQYDAFGYQVGLRAESSDYQGKLEQTGDVFKVQYPLSLFPSALVSYRLTEKQTLQLNYSRRVNRPNFFQIVPFVDSTDIFNMSKGNAGLKPEFTNSLELQYVNAIDRKNTLLVSAYYKHTNNLITRYIEQGNNGSLINTYINANSSYATGFELISTNGIKDWLDITTSVNVYNSKINSSAFQTFTSSARWAWYGKLNVSFKLPKQFMIQWTTMYQSKSNLPVNDGNKMWGPPMDRVQSTSQGYIDQFWAMDISVRKTFFEKKFAVTLSVSDMFGTKRYISVSQSEYFYQNYDRLANPFMVRLNLSWTFGKVDTTLFKRLNKGMGEEPAME